MRRSLALAAVVAVVLIAAAGVAYAYTLTREVLVSHTVPTLIPRSGSYWGWELINNSPNSEDCAIGANTADGGSPVYVDGGLVLGSAGVAATGHARSIAAGASWSGSEQPNEKLWCLAATADQSAGAATVLTESP